MSDFKFDCPKCGQNIVCDTSNAGMNIPCPTCQTLLTVPQPPASTLVPGVPQGGGKLSISKSAPSHAQPPPGATTAPAAATWGQKPAAAAPKKKMPKGLVTTLVVVVICGVLAVVWFTVGASKLKEYQDKKAQEEAQKKAAAEVQRKAAEEAARPKPKPSWKMDLAKADFPDRPAAGKHHGVDFTAEKALFQNAALTLLQTSGSSRQFVIFLPIKLGESVAGRSFDVSADDTTRQPQVTMNWKTENPKIPGTQNFTNGYAMKLEFGEVGDGKLPGKIYLCVPDDEKSYVAGNFEITSRTFVRKPGGSEPRPEKRKKE